MTDLLEVKDLKTQFFTRQGVVKAVDGLSFSVARGKTLAIVGESGSGKSVSMMSLLGLIPSPPGKVVGGTARFLGKDLLKLSEKELSSIRGNDIAMIFQDPMTSLNPYLRISTQLIEVLTTHGGLSKVEAKSQAIAALDLVGIPDAIKRIDNYPHQFSGGMRQRVMIAMAIISRPKLLIADEPTTALDVTVQAQILEVLSRMQKDLNMGMIVITHDLGVVARVADEVLVMYAGKPVERASVEDLYYSPQHPYTKALLKSLPQASSVTQQRLYSIPGLPPDPSKLGLGCPFSPRCPEAMDICKNSELVPSNSVSHNHQFSCHLGVQN